MVEHASYLPEKQHGEKGQHITTISQERLREIASIPDEEINTKDIPELDADFWQNATLSFKGKPINELTPQEKKSS